jgi:hypothetical protein
MVIINYIRHYIIHISHLANKCCVDGNISSFLHLVVTFPPCMIQILITVFSTSFLSNQSQGARRTEVEAALCYSCSVHIFLRSVWSLGVGNFTSAKHLFFLFSFGVCVYHSFIHSFIHSFTHDIVSYDWSIATRKSSSAHSVIVLLFQFTVSSHSLKLIQ